MVHIKKTTVIKFLCSDSPKRQPIRLRVEQLIQRIKAARVAGLPIDLNERLFNCLLDLWRFRATAFQTPLDDLLFTNALCDAFWIGFGAFWQIFERSKNALQFRIEVFLLVFRKIVQPNFQNVSIRPRSDRQSALAWKYGDAYTSLIPSASRYGTISRACEKVNQRLNCNR